MVHNTSRQHPPFVTPLIDSAEKGARLVHARSDDRVRRLKLIAGTAAATLVIGCSVIGWSAAAGAQEPTPPPLPPAQDDQAAPQPQAPRQAVTAPTPAPAPNPTNSPTGNLPALPFGQDGVRDVQNQLIALGFNPGAADGEAGPATIAAAQQYNENRGGSGPVPIDGALLARLQQDTGPRLTPQQVAARSQPHYPSAPSNPVVGVMHQFESGLRGLFNGN
jgi:hypothetical protein